MSAAHSHCGALKVVIGQRWYRISRTCVGSSLAQLSLVLLLLLSGAKTFGLMKLESFDSPV